MKVKELIEQLEQQDLEAEVLFATPYDNYDIFTVDQLVTETGKSIKEDWHTCGEMLEIWGDILADDNKFVVLA